MAQNYAPATLSTPYGTVTFNNATGDEYRITEITGLDGAPIRSAISDRPQTDGGLVHNQFLGPRHITIEGQLIVRSTTTSAAVIGARNTMEDFLVNCLSSILRADGVWAFTRTGAATRSIVVRNDVAVTFQGNRIKTFVFGLVAANPYIS